MAKKDILKEAIADAKTVREVALANAKSALEEAFTPKLQSMLSAKLQEELDEEYYDEDDKDMDEMYYDEDEKDMDEMMYDEDENMEEDSMDEEIDLEEILNELELEENEEVSEKKNPVKKLKKDFKDKLNPTFEGDKGDEEKLDEMGRPIYKAEYTGTNHHYTADKIMEDNKEFDLDSLLKEINSLEEPPKRVIKSKVTPQVRNKNRNINESNKGCKEVISNNRNTLKENHSLKSELEKTKEAFELVKGELNEVNLLNSKLLYVNRIFKANNLDDSQKLRVVETLDRAESIKDAKLIYETIKDSFKISKDSKKVKKFRQPIKENFGMASKAAGVSRSKMLKTAPKKAIISESDNMVSRFQKLANINIK